MIEENDSLEFFQTYIAYIKGSIEYTNNDTMTVYAHTSKESASLSTNKENVFLIRTEDDPYWFYLVSSDYAAQGFINIYDISEKSFYGDPGKNANSGNFYQYRKNIEYEIVKQNENIRRYGPLLTINHNGKTTEFWNNRFGMGFIGVNILLLDYYPEYNEALIYEQYWEGSSYLIYNLDEEKYKCKGIDIPYFNNARTYMFSFGYEDDTVLVLRLPAKLYSINNGTYTEIYNGHINIFHEWREESIQWLNDHKLAISFGEAGSVIFDIGDEIKVTNNLIPIPTW
jgi:hypothetical protein